VAPAATHATKCHSLRKKRRDRCGSRFSRGPYKVLTVPGKRALALRRAPVKRMKGVPVRASALANERMPFPAGSSGPFVRQLEAVIKLHALAIRSKKSAIRIALRGPKKSAASRTLRWIQYDPRTITIELIARCTYTSAHYKSQRESRSLQEVYAARRKSARVAR